MKIESIIQDNMIKHKFGYGQMGNCRCLRCKKDFIGIIGTHNICTSCEENSK